MKYLFSIYQKKNKELGVGQYSDRIFVMFDSENPGGNPGDFEQLFSESLRGWCSFEPEVTINRTDAPVQFDPNVQVRYTFSIVRPEELGAGIIGFSDTVICLLESRRPGGVPENFSDTLRLALIEWYDGAKVSQIKRGRSEQ